MLNQDKKTSDKVLFFENIYDDGKFFWFTEFNYNALFKIDKINWNVKFVGFFPNESIMQERLYIDTIVVKKKMYFTPHSANEIAMYDLDKNIFKKFSIPMPHKNNGIAWQSAKFLKSVQIKEKIYFIPYNYPGILRFDTETEEITCLDFWIDEVEKKRVSDWGYFFDFVLKDDKLVLPCACANVVLIFDLLKQNVQMFQMPDTNCQCKCCGIYYFNNYFYLISAKGKISIRKLESEYEEIKEIKLPDSGDYIEFYPIIQLNEYIYMFPFNNNKGFRVNIKTKQFEEIKWIDDEIKCRENSTQILRKFYTAIPSNGKIYTLTGDDFYFVEYNFDNKNKRMFKFYLTEKDFDLILEGKKREFVQNLYEKNEVMIENSSFTIKLMLEVILEFKEDGIKKEKNFNKSNKTYSLLK